ncbi:MAG: tetratricopeptide repeat protein [Proteobacteria bacterium]|nr:tetratricopeptide repeat protein [Pseudomonadota bacterium]MBU1708473.1 tetratricopeptide repeat protein [Pseudomonadota bacterium]
MPDSVAEIEYKIYLEFKPDDILTLNKLGMVLYRRNKLDEAIKTFTKIIELDSKNADAYDGLGLISANKQDYLSAVEYYQKAIFHKPKDIWVHYHLGKSLEAIGRFMDAETAYETALNNYKQKFSNQSPAKNSKYTVEMIKTSLKNVQLKLSSLPEKNNEDK